MADLTDPNSIYSHTDPQMVKSHMDRCHGFTFYTSSAILSNNGMMKLLWATNMQCESVERRIGEVFSKHQLEVELNHNLATKTDMTMFRLQDEGISATEVKKHYFKI